MGGFWTRSTSTNSATASSGASPIDDTDSVSVRPAPMPVKALTTPFGSQPSDPTAHGNQTGPHANDSTASPRVKHSALPQLPFVPSPEVNPDLKGEALYKADPSSILLSYPRSNVDHTHDFYGLYNPPETTFWSLTR